jgi:hypothetical protein
MTKAKKMKVYLRRLDGSQLEAELFQHQLADCGIIKYQDSHFLFCYFVHGESGAVQYEETRVCYL